MAALIARNQTAEMPHYFNLALDNGVEPSELSEIITHLAFYAGWSNAMSAVAAAKDVFSRRGIGSDNSESDNTDYVITSFARKVLATLAFGVFGQSSL